MLLKLQPSVGPNAIHLNKALVEVVLVTQPVIELISATRVLSYDRTNMKAATNACRTCWDVCNDVFYLVGLLACTGSTASIAERPADPGRGKASRIRTVVVVKRRFDWDVIRPK